MEEITGGYDGTNYWEKRQDKIILIGDSEKTSILNSTAFLRNAEWQKNLVSYSYEGIMQRRSRTVRISRRYNLWSKRKLASQYIQLFTDIN
jgi:uncharacterized protein (DUF2132 family)